MLILGIIDIPLWILLTVFITVTLYWRGTRNHDYFKSRGIPGPTPWPFFGFDPRRLFTVDLYTMDRDNINKYGKVFGYFMGTGPELMVADEDMISEITIKQFHNFMDRNPNGIKDKVFNDNLLNLHGEKWKSARSQMSPTFTTGKLRMMTKEINRSAKSFAKRMHSLGEPFEAKGYSENYTMDCIASTAFGIRVDSQSDAENEFNRNGKRFLNFNFASFKFICSFIAPRSLVNLLQALGVDFNLIDAQATQFFLKVFDQTLKSRSAKDKTRADFVQLMLNAQQGQNIQDKKEDGEKEEESTVAPSEKGMNKHEIMANAFLFFFAGFDTVSVGLTQLIYLLTCNPDCQKTLHKEIDREIGDMDEISYDAVVKMHYLDQCINETLRLYPPAFRIDRQAIHDAQVCGVGIKKGVVVTIPILAIHKDPEIWPEPDRFDPDRFSPERKGNIKPTQFMPFGIGPRNCIGMRQALFEIKVAVIQLLKTHKLVKCDKTEIPLKMSRKKIMKSENGVWVALEKRE